MRTSICLFFCLFVAATTAAAADFGIPTARSTGAVGDGVADDTDAIQKAVDLKRGGVRFGAGKFRITRPIVIDLGELGFSSVTSDGPATIVMAGAGPAFRIVGHHDGTAAPRTVKDEVWDRERSPVVEGLEIVGEHADADGVELDGTMQPILSKLTVREARHGIRLVNRNRNVIITGCHLYDNTGAGVLLDRVNLHQFVMGDSHVSYNDAGGVVVRGGNVRNIHVGNCDLEGNMPDGDVPSKAANFLVDLTHEPGVQLNGRYADTVAEMSITGCTIQHSGKNSSSANIRLIGRDNYPVNTVSISGNVMSDAATSVDLENVRGIALTANVFFNAPTDLSIRNGENLTISGNQFDPREYEAQREKEGGVVLANCTNVTLNALQMSEITSERAALLLTECRRVVVTGCQLHDCFGGITLQKCVDCLIANNLISATKGGGALDVANSQNVQTSSNMILSD